MRDVGVFRPTVVTESQLSEAVYVFCKRVGQTCKPRDGELLLGSDPHTAWVFMDTSIANAIFDTEEHEETTKALGFDPKGFVSIHFAWTNESSHLANQLAEELKQKWAGVIDYGGAGGGLGVPPQPSEDL